MKATIRHVLGTPGADTSSILGKVNQLSSPIVQSRKQHPRKEDGTSSNTSSTGNSPGIAITSPSPSRKKAKAPSNTPPLYSTLPILQVHPSYPILCYVDTLGMPNHALPLQDTLPHNATTSTIPSVERQRIVLQNYITNKTIRVFPISQIAQSWLQIIGTDNDNSSSGINSGPDHNTIKKACRDLGFITSVQFLDASILRSNSGHLLQHNSSHLNITSLDPANTSSTLVIQWSNRIILCPMTPPNHSTTTSLPIIEIGQSQLNKAKPTAKPIPILSTSILAIGCSDGAVRFFSRATGKVIKSVRGPNGRNDPVVQVVMINPDKHTNTGKTSTSVSVDTNKIDGNNTDNEDNESVNTAPSLKKSDLPEKTLRMLTICASGTAYLWELQVELDTETGKRDKLKIIPPLAKLNGSVRDSNNSTSTLASNSPPSSGQSTGTDKASMKQYKVEYDPVRELLFWTIGIGSSANNTYVLVWDMRITSIPPSSSDTPVHRPMSRVQIVSNNNDIVDTGSTQNRTLVGLLHPSLPNDALLCLTGSKNGSLNVMVSSLNDVDDSDNSKIPAVPKKSTSLRKTVIYHHFKFSAMKRSVEKRALGLLRCISDDKITLFRIAASTSRPDMVILATNYGIVVVDLKAEDSLVTGSCHVSFSSKIGLNGFVGAGDSAVMVKGSWVFTTNLDFQPSATLPNPVGMIGFKNPIRVYRSPLPIHKSDEFNQRPVRVPPNLLASPSGKFLCLFWHAENRYEILHADSMLRMTRMPTKEDADYLPAIDSGSNVLSFAWVGDEDAFALLHPPELRKGDAVNFQSPNSIKDRKITKKRSNELTEEDEDNDRIDPSKYQPRVELKVLSGITADALELGGNIAAATATNMGDIKLRGRHLPSCLFGGPVLCVGTLSKDGETSQSDGMAYFYSQKDPNDNRAASYISVGPALPYPDLVVWDDNGKLCAVIVGRRVAIYLVDPPNFTTLSTAFVGSAAELDAKVESAKFVHGVLYCATQCSVQCIFLGNLDNDDALCETDILTLSSSSVISTGSYSSVQPSPATMNLYKPSILSYFHGSLLVSTSTGIHAVPLSSPLVRIGTLLAAGHRERAIKWFDAISISNHEILADFLEKRGVPELAAQLPGLSLETCVDICLRHGFTERLERLVELYGFKNLRKIDMGGGINGVGSNSLLECIGAYFLSVGRIDIVQQLISECLLLGEDGKKEAFVTASLLATVDPDAGRKIIETIVKEDSSNATGTRSWQDYLF